jgi:hypothetical protein
MRERRVLAAHAHPGFVDSLPGYKTVFDSFTDKSGIRVPIESGITTTRTLTLTLENFTVRVT